MNTKALIEKIEALPADRIPEIENLVDRIQQEETRKRNWQTTVESIEAARRGELETVGDVDGLMAWLRSDNDADD